MSESPVQDAIREQLANEVALSTRQLAGEDPTREKAIRKGLAKMRARGEVVSRKEGAYLLYQLAEEISEDETSLVEGVQSRFVRPRFGGWEEADGPCVDVWFDHLRRPGHRCLWSVRWISNATPKYPPPQDMTLEQCLFELRDIHDRHLQLMTGTLVLPSGQRKNWDNSVAAALYEAIQADGGPRISDVRNCIGKARQNYPEYVMFAAAGEPSLWPLGNQGSLFLGFVRFRPGWPSPSKKQDWALEAKMAAKTEASPAKAKQIALARAQTMGFLNGDV